jgi:hypothetical protein
MAEKRKKPLGHLKNITQQQGHFKTPGETAPSACPKN